MSLTLSCSLATSPGSPKHARIAETLGYARAFMYDSPAVYPDVWVQLCRAAERTDRIGLGPAVLVPSNRHPMTNAAAIGTLAGVAGAERVVVAIGSGYTARLTVGQKPLSWVRVAEYIRTIRALLRGEIVEWQGASIQMMHSPGQLPSRPIEIPILVAAEGPKGFAVARELGDGVFCATPTTEFPWRVTSAFGTVLEDGEPAGSDRALAAAGHAAAMRLHAAAPGDDRQPAAWRQAYADVPNEVLHLALHYGHHLHVNDRDRPHITGELLASMGLAIDRGAWRERLDELEASGTTEVAYQPAGPDIARELEAFAALVAR
jgi:5,10-methylenetetrahydromethanopterin reductase